MQKCYIGKVLNYFNKAKVAEILLEADSLKKNEEIIITGPTTGLVEAKAEKIVKDGEEVLIAEKKSRVTVKVPEKARKNDKVFAVRQIIKN